MPTSAGQIWHSLAKRAFRLLKGGREWYVKGQPELVQTHDFANDACPSLKVLLQIMAHWR